MESVSSVPFDMCMKREYTRDRSERVSWAELDRKQV
jgi:hypothetical protein